MAQRYKFSIESKSFPLYISGEPCFHQDNQAPSMPNLKLPDIYHELYHELYRELYRERHSNLHLDDS